MISIASSYSFVLIAISLLRPVYSSAIQFSNNSIPINSSLNLQLAFEPIFAKVKRCEIADSHFLSQTAVWSWPLLLRSRSRLWASIPRVQQHRNVQFLWKPHKHCLHRHWNSWKHRIPWDWLPNVCLPINFYSLVRDWRKRHRKLANWNAKLDMTDFGFGTLTVYNNTHLYWQWFESDNDTPLDSVYVIKDH